MPRCPHAVYVRRWMLLVLALTVLGCPKNPPPASVTGPDPADLEVLESLETDNRRLQQTVDDQKRTIEAREAEIGRLQVQLMEREALYRALRDELAAQQERLDEAVVEVVRTKAKLRSIESRAEAASSITEAEIALKGLKDSLTAASNQPGDAYRKAEALLRMSTSEFRKENYGGALYLAGQAQSQIRILDDHVSQQSGPALEQGEVRFALPVPLKVLTRSNLRTGASLEASVLLTLKADTHVVGYAHKGKWIRIQTAEGARGWIYQTLVGSR